MLFGICNLEFSSRRREMALFPNNKEIGSTQDFLRFAEIHDNTIILKDGNLRQVLLCSSINFSLKSEQEQTAIIFGYQNFLNSLNFPIQILMQSKKLDLSNYLKKLGKLANSQQNELLRMQNLDYIDFIKRLINLANIMDKRFYVVISFMLPPKANLISTTSAARVILTTTEFANYKKELDQRVQVTQSGLGSIGVRSALLETQQLIELLYGVYNPEEANKQKLTEAENLQGEVIESAVLAPANKQTNKNEQ